MIHRRSPRCVDNLTAEATHVPARVGGYGPIRGGFIKGFSSRYSQSTLNPRRARRGGFGESRAGSAGAPQSRADVWTRIEARRKAMSLLMTLGTALRGDRFRLSLPVAETILRALVVYLLTLIERGRIRQDGLAKELLTELELLMGGVVRDSRVSKI